MKFIIVAACLAVTVHCQSPAFDSFMSRNRQLFSDIVASSSTANLQQSQSGQWRPQSDQRAGRSLSPSVSYAPEPISPFVTSNSHIQAFNAPSQPQPQQFTPPQFTPQQHHQHSPSFQQQQQPAGSPTTISGPNFQTSITLPALPALPQHPAGSPAALAHQQILQAQQQAQQQQQQQPQFQPQPQQFTSNNQFPSLSSSSSRQQLVNQQQPSTSFFNSQGNTNFPFNFNPSTPFPQQPVSQPAQSVPQTFNSFGFFNNQPQPQPQSQPQPQAFPAFGSSPSTTIKAPGFETTFVFMRPSEQQIQGASLSKIIRDPSGLEKQMFYSPMPNYSPPSVYTTQIVHNNPLQQQQQQQGQQV